MPPVDFQLVSDRPAELKLEVQMIGGIHGRGQLLIGMKLLPLRVIASFVGALALMTSAAAK